MADQLILDTTAAESGPIVGSDFELYLILVSSVRVKVKIPLSALDGVHVENKTDYELAPDLLAIEGADFNLVSSEPSKVYTGGYNKTTFNLNEFELQLNRFGQGWNSSPKVDMVARTAEFTLWYSKARYIVGLDESHVYRILEN